MRNSDSDNDTSEEDELFTEVKTEKQSSSEHSFQAESQTDGPIKFFKKVAKLTRRISKSSFSEETLPSSLRPVLTEVIESGDGINTGSTQNQPYSANEESDLRETETRPHMYRKRNENPRASLSNDFVYNFSHAKRGVAILIVNYNFRNKELNRPYATKDEEIFSDLLGAMNFEIMPLINKKTDDLLVDLKKIIEGLDRNSDCVACLVSTHGCTVNKQHVIYTYDNSLETHRIIQMFREDRCRQLAGKPKLFFIQACRSLPDIKDGSDADPGSFITVQGQQNIRSQETRCNRTEREGYTDNVETQQDSGQRISDVAIMSQETVIHREQEEESKEVVQSCDKTEFSEANVLNAELGNHIDNLPYADEDADNSGNSQTSADDFSRYPRRPEEEQRRYYPPHHDRRRPPAYERFVEKQPSSTRPAADRKRPHDQQGLQKDVLPDIDFCSIPCYEDFLVMFSSAPERIAWADDYRGGWLPQCMYKAIRKLVKQNFRIDLLEALTEVNGKMAVDMETIIYNDKNYDKGKATACIYHKLTKDVIIKPKCRPIYRQRPSDGPETQV